jgi:hypothetical protein
VPRRQLIVFTIGCWVAILTAAVHVYGHVSGPTPPANETERQLMNLANNYQMSVPGGAGRSLMDFMNGFSLSFAVFLALIGTLGLMIRKRGHDDGPFMRAVSRALAGGGLVLVVISMTHWFVVPSLFLALMTVCFMLAAVTPPE